MELRRHTNVARSFSIKITYVLALVQDSPIKIRSILEVAALIILYVCVVVMGERRGTMDTEEEWNFVGQRTCCGIIILSRKEGGTEKEAEYEDGHQL